MTGVGSGDESAPPAAPAVLPPSAGQWAHQVRELLDRRRVAQARRVLSQALPLHPDDTELLFEAARADYLDDRNDDARNTLEHLLSVDPADPAARFLLFALEMDSGRLAEAELLILALLRESPAAPHLYAAYCRLMLRALHFRKARALADEAVRLAPHAHDALRARALCDLVDQRGRVDSQALAKLVAEDPNDLHTLRLVVVALVQAQRAREAQRLARQLLRAQPDDPYLLGLVRSLHVQNHWSLWPLWPLQRWGWTASIVMWVAVIVLFQVLRNVAPQALGVTSTVVLVYIAYSWIWPPLFKRWVERN